VRAVPLTALVVMVLLAVQGCSRSAAARGVPASPPATGPAPQSGGSAHAPPTAPVGPTTPQVTYVFPVAGPSSYGRTHHDYPATDILAPCGAPVLAATTGTVLAVSRTDTFHPDVNAGATRGGLSVSILGDDGVRYYGSHLSSVNAGIDPAVRITAGQPLGTLGRTGHASACHLHFGISPPCGRTGDWWIQRGTIWPWPYLDAWRAADVRSAAAEVAAWQATHGCPPGPLTDP
jgi:murein DD-endopeptidase MepM/ murein hydrolase activator NlpD